MPRGDQHSRQWRFLLLLGRPAGVAVEDASQRLGCTVRTVWRDLGVLHEAGFPIYDERDGRRGLWKVERAFLDRLPIPFSLPEVVALLARRDMLDQAGAGPFGPSVASAFAKIEALMTPRALALVVGTAVYEGDLAPFWPYLVFGQWTHVGSRTTFGLGRYVIEPVAAGDRAAEARG